MRAHEHVRARRRARVQTRAHAPMRSAKYCRKFKASQGLGSHLLSYACTRVRAKKTPHPSHPPTDAAHPPRCTALPSQKDKGKVVCPDCGQEFKNTCAHAAVGCVAHVCMGGACARAWLHAPLWQECICMARARARVRACVHTYRRVYVRVCMPRSAHRRVCVYEHNTCASSTCACRHDHRLCVHLRTRVHEHVDRSGLGMHRLTCQGGNEDDVVCV